MSGLQNKIHLPPDGAGTTPAARIRSIGIDNGGTWLRIASVDKEGAVVKSLRTHAPSLTKLAESIKNTFQLWKIEAVPCLVVGSKGIWTRGEKMLLRNKLLSFSETPAVLSDVELAYHSHFKGKPGILVVAGTGSIAYGRNGNKIARAGGLGLKNGDPGSGRWIGKRWATATKAGQAGWAPLVINRAEKGDVIPAFIVREAAVHLSKLVWETAKKLGFDGSIPLACHGGIFKNKFFKKEFLSCARFFFPGQKIEDIPAFQDAAACAARMGLDGSWKNYLGAGNPPR